MKKFFPIMFISKKIRLSCYIFFLGIFSILLSWSVRAELVDQVAAVVNDEIITLSELLRVVQVNSPDAPPSVYREVLEKMIEQKLIDQATKDIPVNVSEEEIDSAVNRLNDINKITLQQLKTTLEQQGVTWEEYRKEIGEQIRRNQAIMQIIRPEVNVSDKEIKEYYENHPDDFFKPAQAKIEQIFFPVPNQATPEKEKAILQCAEESLKKIISGENFQNVAMETNLPDYSPSCDVGIYKKGELVGSIDQQAFALTPGELSNIIKTSKGYCIIRVIERSSEQTEKIEETRQAISNFLMQQKMETKIQEWMKKIRTNAYIDIKI